MMNYYGFYRYGDFFPWGILGAIANICWWIFLAWLFISLVRHFRHSSKDLPEGDSALKILRERYAKGEITKKEFDSIKKDLG